jgi:hypothetical protein
MAKLQRDRAIAQGVGFILLLCVGIGGFFVSFIPMLIQITCFVLCPISLFGVFADLRLRDAYRRKAEDQGETNSD